MKIQAQFRGYQVRKGQAGGTADEGEAKEASADDAAAAEADVEQPPSLRPSESDTAELEQAAVKIQAQFRGFQVRKAIPTRYVQS